MKKVFLGLSNIASQFVDLKEGFKDLGYNSMSVINYGGGTIVNNKVDYDLNRLKSFVPEFEKGRILKRIKFEWDTRVDKYIYKKAIKECDIFIFFWNTFKHNFSDLAELKRLGKKIIFVFVGDDVRWYPAMKQEFEKYKLPPIEYNETYDYGINGLTNRLSRLRNGEKFADFIFSRVDQSQISLRPFYKWNMMVNCKTYKENNIQRKDKPIIVHAPSSREFKGTKYILEAFEKLKKEGINFEYRLIENMAHLDAVKEYGNADILIDQLLCPGSGKLATEALALGKIVMSHMAYETYPQNTPKDCPIIDVNPTDLYSKLKEVISNYEFRVSHAKKGRPYVEKNLDVRLFCKMVADLNEGKEIEYYYYPTFYRDSFIPESIESIVQYNKWDNLVRDCNWYKKYIHAGNRAGLQF